MLAAKLAPLVLVVDDCAEIRALYAEMLCTAGLRVALAADGVDGVQQALALRPAVILMDAIMPRLDGLAAAHQLKQDIRTSSIPVILSTGQPLREQARQAGYAFLEKPCSLLALVAAVKAQLPP